MTRLSPNNTATLLLATLALTLAACTIVDGESSDRPDRPDRPGTPSPTPPSQTPPPGSAENKPVTLDLRALQFHTAPLDLMRASVYYRPRSNEAARFWFTEFPQHEVVRINTFEWELHESTSLEDFRRRLEARRGFVEALAKSHRRIIVHLSLMPSWLSSSTDGATAEGYWRNLHAHSPRDWDAWRAVVREGVKFFTGIPGPRWYFEVWNEPDLFYWQEGNPEMLRLYAETARAVKDVAPNAPVGGLGVNQWDGRLKAEKSSRNPLTLELIRHAAREKIPLDFVSWHVFASDPNVIATARQAYEGAARQAGLQRMPEWLVTEWNAPSAVRGGAAHPAIVSDLFLGLAQAGVALQTFSTWENFDASAGMKGYGLLLQGGKPKPAYHAFHFFDLLARDSQGVAAHTTTTAYELEGALRMAVSRKAGGIYEIVAWQVGYDLPLAAASQTLIEQGVSRDAMKAYGSVEGLRSAIRAGKAKSSAQQPAFEAARAVYARNEGPASLTLEFPGFSSVRLLEARSVGKDLQRKEGSAEGNRLRIGFEKLEVLWMRVQLQ